MNSVYTHIAVPVLGAVAMNASIFSQKLRISKTRNPYIPPGGIVGLIWMILFALLGYVHYRLYMQNGQKLSTGCIILIVFWLYSLAYPILTSFSGNPSVYFALNLGAFFFALAILMQVQQENSDLVPWTFPLLLWTGYVNLI